ncbi:sensitivity to high expression protein she9 [Linnemannia zychae]|nr:sensitivity to high expression protein she9 [Linnemannia zychae]
MASPFCLIRPAGAFSRNQGSILASTSLHSSLQHAVSFSNGRSVAFEAKRVFSNSALRKNIGDGKSQAQIGEEEASKKLAEEAERKRLQAQDAALKEILENAAAEKKKLEEEARKIAEEKARQAAKEAAEAEAARLAKAKAEAQAREAAERAAAEAAKQAAEKQAASERLQLERAQAARSKVESPATNSTSGESITGTNSFGKEIGSAARLSASSNSNSTKSTPDSAKGQPGTIASEASSGFKDDPLEQLKSRLLPYTNSLVSSTDNLRSNVSAGLRDLCDSIKRKDYKETVAQLSEHLNNFTGYNAINDLKHKVTTHGTQLDAARGSLVKAKQAYEDAIKTRSDTQKAINDLLQRKHLWSPNDVIRFTDLYRSEHANEQAELKCKQEYKQAESNVEEKSRRLMTIIMERYHEEQVWSDKIRAASTYGTWGLIGMNILAFLIVQGFVEPRRRRKQVERYEELVQDLTERGILPEKTAAHSPTSTNTTGISAGAVAQINHATNSEDTEEIAPVTVGAALLGGEDVLLKMIQSAERQEDRLDRMEQLLRQQFPGAIETSGSDQSPVAEQKGEIEGAEETNKDGEFIVAEDGTLLFVVEEKDAGTVDMGELLDEEVTRGSVSQGKSTSIVFYPSNRLSRILKDGDAEVVATRRDFLLSGLGGAIIGGLVTLAFMMNR